MNLRPRWECSPGIFFWAGESNNHVTAPFVQHVVNSMVLRLWLLAPALCAVGCAAAPSGAVAPPAASSAAPENVNPVQQEGADTKRQIVYRASLTLSVQDFGETEKSMAALIKSSGGYVAQFREDRPYGAQRGGHWTVRVPVPQFDTFLEAASKLGVADHREVQAEDVTEEYVDLSARLKNKQQLETRLLELVAKRSDEIKDVIAIEAELARVREEIERMQGRLRYLANRVAMTTVEITAYQRESYRPPEALTFAARLSQTFWDSVNALRQCGEAWILACVAILPWITVLVAIAAPFVWWARRHARKSRARVVQAQGA
jgi:uncharacterized coiled-coil protein SlyX